MAAWYVATAMAKQYEAALPFIEGNRLAPWMHGYSEGQREQAYLL